MPEMTAIVLIKHACTYCELDPPSSECFASFNSLDLYSDFNRKRRKDFHVEPLDL